jgi:hypothetical protein
MLCSWKKGLAAAAPPERRKTEHENEKLIEIL